MAVQNRNKDKIKLLSLDLYTEIINDMGDVDYFLKAVYEHTNEYVKERIIIPQIRLGVNPHNLIINHATCYNHEANVDLGFGILPIVSVDGAAYIVNVLEEYPQKMTLDEIEKKLGYKVEIVSKK